MSYQGKVQNLSYNKDGLERKIKKLENEVYEQEMNYKKENELLKLNFSNDVQALKDRVADLERIIKGAQDDLQIERREKVKLIERKDVEIRNLNSIIMELRESSKKLDLDYSKQLQALELIIQQNKDKYSKDKKEATDKYEDIISKQKEQYEVKLQKQIDDYESRLRVVWNQLK